MLASRCEGLAADPRRETAYAGYARNGRTTKSKPDVRLLCARHSRGIPGEHTGTSGTLAAPSLALPAARIESASRLSHSPFPSLSPSRCMFAPEADSALSIRCQYLIFFVYRSRSFLIVLRLGLRLPFSI